MYYETAVIRIFKNLFWKVNLKTFFLFGNFMCQSVCFSIRNELGKTLRSISITLDILQLNQIFEPFALL